MCLSVVREPLALFSCEYTLNGSHSAPVTHTFGAGGGPLEVIYFTHLLFTEQMSDCALGCTQQRCRPQSLRLPDTVLQVEVLLYPSLQFAHCSVDTRRPVFCSLKAETCSEPVCLPRLLLALGVSPRGCPQPHGTEGQGWNLRQKPNWIFFSDQLGLAVAQTPALPRSARRVWRPPQCHRASLPLLRSRACERARPCVAEVGRSALAALRCLSFNLFFFFFKSQQLPEVSQKRSSFTKMNPASVNWSNGCILALSSFLLQQSGELVHALPAGFTAASHPKGTRRRKRSGQSWA